jgi:hypothetical protein
MNERRQKRAVARNTVRNVLAGSDAVGKMTILGDVLSDVLADLRAEGEHMGRLLARLEAEAARQEELAAGAHLVVRRLLPVSENVEGPTVLTAVRS